MKFNLFSYTVDPDDIFWEGSFRYNPLDSSYNQLLPILLETKVVKTEKQLPLVEIKGNELDGFEVFFDGKLNAGFFPSEF